MTNVNKLMITQERLKELFYYNQQLGIFVRRVATSNRIKVGDIAGSVKRGYLLINIGARAYLAHRLAFLYMTGSFPDHTDHINGVENDNRWSNLRDVSHQENMKNKRLCRKNKSGITGVRWVDDRSSWFSYINISGKMIYLYRGKDLFEACCRRKSAELKHNFHANHGRK